MRVSHLRQVSSNNYQAGIKSCYLKLVPVRHSDLNSELNMFFTFYHTMYARHYICNRENFLYENLRGLEGQIAEKSLTIFCDERNKCTKVKF